MIDPMERRSGPREPQRARQRPTQRRLRARRERATVLLAKLLSAAACFAIGSAQAASVQDASADGFPAWAFPVKPATPDKVAAGGTQSVPGSRVRLRDAQIHDISTPPDWFPQEHPPMPAPVGATGATGRWACAYCHLPGGEGRPENASLAGLPAAYIRAQVEAFAHGERHGARPDWVPGTLMTRVARDADDSDIARAADYFSRLSFATHVRVVESDTVPAHAAAAYAYAPVAGSPVALGARIIEMPVDLERFELRDPHSRFVAYVPRGSVARGRKLAQDGAAPCASCHGAGLRGGEGSVAPPLAGRSPTYLFRQLFGFGAGTRTSAAAQPMRALVANFSEADRIALAAYAASLAP